MVLFCSLKYDKGGIMEEYVNIQLVRETIAELEEEIAEVIEGLLDPLEAEFGREEGWARKSSSEMAKCIVFEVLFPAFRDYGTTPGDLGFLPYSIEKIENVLRNGPLGSDEYYHRILVAVAWRLVAIAGRDKLSPEEGELLRAAGEATQLRIRKEVWEIIG